jgi:hypothetical protein
MPRRRRGVHWGRQVRSELTTCPLPMGKRERTGGFLLFDSSTSCHPWLERQSGLAHRNAVFR